MAREPETVVLNDRKPVSAAEYNRSYYERNKDKIAKRKASRYQNDPEYRERILARRAQQREEEKEARRKKERKPRAQRAPKRMRIPIGNTGQFVVVNMYSVGKLAFHVGVSTQTIHKWEKQGAIPPASFRSSGGHRLYTEKQVEIMTTVYRKHLNLSDGAWRITDEFVREMHERLGKLQYGVSPEETEDDTAGEDSP